MDPTQNMTDEEYYDYIYDFVRPNALEFSLIPIFGLMLVIGLVGNFLVVFVVIRNDSMKTVTNIFLVNLALADFLVLLFCLPFTVLWDTTKTWWFGTPLCKVILYLQTVSISVSVITLTCISVERWYAICNPLSFKNTFERTRTILIFTWTIGLLLSLPEMIVLQVTPFNFARPNITTIALSQCDDTWSELHQKIYQILQTIVLFIMPLMLMTCMYGQIAYVLWVKSVPPSDPCQGSFRCKDRSADDMWNVKIKTTIDQSKEREILIRRKAAKMLIAVVALFAICYFPTHVVNLLKLFKSFEPSPLMGSVTKLGMRLLCYFNSCINPIIYNFMSEKFQREFSRACCCLPSKFRMASASRMSTFAPGVENATLILHSRRQDESRVSFIR